ncbi:MAG: T9SS type A sorting domain-containing protein [Bacteroidota bacterium]|nr:T9SS type A sorting domain-containing protein [Bacteroidota bacterium]MDP4232346.1 T9SS type A sorting domain-containing protein [Bacteroidota bacterium]MDP4241485.1 T9SS type A sorting domain-containing protein [Bacteroidota bacterium]MDP4286691.1 T9SS type A sorting domain-containing protein [Bacteroidota bacterium]
MLPQVMCYFSKVGLLLIALICITGIAHAQANGGSQDSATSGTLRPRWGSYLIQTFPSPAKVGDQITVQFYNHQNETLTCRVFDIANRFMVELQPKQLTQHGLHTFTIPANRLSSGTYFIRLTTFTESGAEDVVDNSRFLIVH